jgi:hypothetical protein
VYVSRLRNLFLSRVLRSSFGGAKSPPSLLFVHDRQSLWNVLPSFERNRRGCGRPCLASASLIFILKPVTPSVGSGRHSTTPPKIIRCAVLACVPALVMVRSFVVSALSITCHTDDPSKFDELRRPLVRTVTLIVSCSVFSSNPVIFRISSFCFSWGHIFSSSDPFERF